MRACLALALIAFAIGAPALAQPKEQVVQTSRAIYANLQTEIKGAPFASKMRLKELIEQLGEQLSQGREVTIAIDEEAFREEAADVADIYETEVNLRSIPAKTSALNVLRQAIKQLPIKSALIVRAGKVEIVPTVRTSKEWLLNQTFNVDFKDRPLDAALEELSELTGVSIVMDARAKQKAQTPVTARFRNDVALQDAVRMLTDMAELKIVYMVTGMYITTPEHAQVMQEELKQLYGSPSAPPLPPARQGKAKEGA